MPITELRAVTMLKQMQKDIHFQLEVDGCCLSYKSKYGNVPVDVDVCVNCGKGLAGHWLRVTLDIINQQRATIKACREAALVSGNDTVLTIANRGMKGKRPY